MNVCNTGNDLFKMLSNAHPIVRMYIFVDPCPVIFIQIDPKPGNIFMVAYCPFDLGFSIEVYPG